MEKRDSGYIMEVDKVQGLVYESVDSEMRFVKSHCSYGKVCEVVTGKGKIGKGVYAMI